jgi:Protein of unknown function (DUF4242)
MPRYLIERIYTVDVEKLPEVATRSKAIGHHRYPEIVWEHSHVVVDSEGTPRSYCIYEAPSEEMVREHAELLGDHSIQEIYEVAGDVSPAPHRRSGLGLASLRTGHVLLDEVPESLRSHRLPKSDLAPELAVFLGYES